MNAYRVALILCRAVAVALWWMAGIRLLSLVIMAILVALNIGGLKVIPILPFSAPSAISLVPLAIGAGFLQMFAASLATSMTGGSAFAGDSIASSRVLDATEKPLGNAGAGIILLFLGAVNAMPALLSGVYALFSGGFGSGTGAAFMIFNLIGGLIPACIECVVGFILAFLLGLRRVVKSP